MVERSAKQLAQVRFHVNYLVVVMGAFLASRISGELADDAGPSLLLLLAGGRLLLGLVLVRSDLNGLYLLVLRDRMLGRHAFGCLGEYLALVSF